MTTEPILTLENVSIGYDPAKAVIENLSLSLMKGEKSPLWVPMALANPLSLKPSSD